MAGLASGCVAPQGGNTGLANTPATIVAEQVEELRNETAAVRLELGKMVSEQRAGRDVNEPWTARLLALVLGWIGLYAIKYRVPPVRRAFDWMQGKQRPPGL